MRTFEDKFFVGCGALIALFFVVMVGGGLVLSIAAANNRDTITCTVKEKDVLYTGSSGSTTRDYRIYTEDCGTLEVYDQFFLGTFDSADRFSNIEEGRTYEFGTAGFRIPILSMFPNIIEIKEIE